MYDYKNGNNIMFVLEDGVKKSGEFQVRSRMVLKKSTLIKWMQVLKSGTYLEKMNNRFFLPKCGLSTKLCTQP